MHCDSMLSFDHAVEVTQPHAVTMLIQIETGGGGNRVPAHEESVRADLSTEAYVSLGSAARVSDPGAPRV